MRAKNDWWWYAALGACGVLMLSLISMSGCAVAAGAAAGAGAGYIAGHEAGEEEAEQELGRD